MTLWLTTDELKQKPTSGAGWDYVKRIATGSWGTANISDMSSNHNTAVLAGAYYAVRTGDAKMKTKTEQGLAQAVGTESDGQVLSLGRYLAAYLIAADTVNYHDPKFVAWVDAVRTKTLQNNEGGTSTMVNRHETRANNWGACCGMSRVAADLYLDDKTDLERAVQVWQGWMGDRSKWGVAPNDFFFGAAGTSWAHDEKNPVPVNPKGAVKNGRNIDGVLPSDQNRTGEFTWPPPCGNYPHGVTGFVLTTVEMLRRNGYPSCHLWSDSAPTAGSGVARAEQLPRHER